MSKSATDNFRRRGRVSSLIIQTGRRRRRISVAALKQAIAIKCAPMSIQDPGIVKSQYLLIGRHDIAELSAADMQYRILTTMTIYTTTWNVRRGDSRR